MGSRYFALISGIIYILIGILGFIPSLVVSDPATSALVVEAGAGYLMGLFPINILHNLVHLGVGIWGVASYPSFDRSRLFARGLAIFYGVLAIMGLIPVLQTTFGLIPIFGNDVWLHALTALIAGFVGFMTPPESAVQSAQKQPEMTGTRR